MKLKDREIMFTSIAMVLDKPVSKDSVFVEEFSEIIPVPLNVGDAAGGRIRIISSPRSQIDIMLEQNRVQLRDNSGLEPGEKPLSRVAIDTLAKLKRECRAFGLNYDLVFSLESRKPPGEVIRDKFLNAKTLRTKIISPVLATAVRLRYLKHTKTYNLILEPHGDLASDKLHVHLNVHQDARSLPPHDTLAESFKTSYGDLVRLVESL
ncbi:hypothetical protein E3J95_00910 [Candidatus Aerophobetes bacterium]|uniref:Uncharacterized protein n=1 Tax=Aerophobetes bacterium TaxID=2030807 RepID=A0A523QM78_UNCAE|nr:MAG: hypothetical protein E3J95_00910 [Candidatus Aerophobetes bacterium]